MNLELEVLKMKIIIIFIDLLMATVLFLLEDFYQIKEYRKKCAVFIRRLYWIKYRENMQSYWKTD